MEKIEKKLGTKLKAKTGILKDEDMKAVYGGFCETGDLPTRNLEIECIKCHTTDPDKISGTVYFDTVQNTVEYHCSCGASFVVKDGYAIDKAVWVQECAKRGYTYKNA
ncbi:MAG: hypothetical protein IK139_06570 [Lachnospiraceae bacterium]|nr:hypothetical protein [Lachnospiraceae bacterium]